MRTQEVEDALRFRAHSWASEVLAAEVERLEKRENELLNALDMGQINCDAVYDELREEREGAKQRAEAAEARVAELEQIVSLGDKIAIKHTQIIADLSAQNARLREAAQAIIDWSIDPQGYWDDREAARLRADLAGLKAALADGKAAP